MGTKTKALIDAEKHRRRKRIREARLGEQVARFAAAGHSEEDPYLVAGQAFAGARRRRPPAR